MGLSTCSQRVRAVLFEKALEWESVLLTPPDLRAASFLALNENGTVPVLIHGGVTLAESRLIAEYLDEAFPDPPLMPELASERADVRRWTKLFDDRLQLALFVVTFVARLRATYLEMSEEQRAAALPGLNDPVKREVASRLLDDGWASPIIIAALRQFRAAIRRTEHALATGHWLCGRRFTLADSDMLVAFSRLSALGLADLWLGQDATAAWLERGCGRRSFQKSMWQPVASEEANVRRAFAPDMMERFAPMIAASR